jgi:glycosyltransferase involved in cell wall biosynthesis
MLRFVFVTTFYPPHHFGGDAVLVRHMAEALVRAGHAVEVIYDVDAYRASSGAAPDPAPPPDTDGIRVHALRSRLGLVSSLLTHQIGRPVVHRRAIARLLGSGVDVLHYHNVSLVGGPGVLAYGVALKLYTAHEHWLVCPTHVLWRHDREPCAGRQCLRCVARYRRPPQLWRFTGLLERSARHVDAFCSPSRFSIDKHREFGFERPMELLPPFLPDTPASAGRADVTERQRPIFLFVGRLERIKGLHDVIPVFTGAAGSGSGSTPPGLVGDAAGAELWIAGEGNQEEELRRLAGGAERVRFLGRVTPDEVQRLLRRARALIVPSVGFEVFPLVLLEAFREATPVIARRLGPFPEVMEASGGGLLFTTSDDLRAAVERLASDPEGARRLGARARASFESSWSEAAFLRRYLELIAAVARRTGRAELLRRLGNPPAPVGTAAASPAAVERQGSPAGIDLAPNRKEVRS